ncbi:MAG: aspartate carbamoyltransferase regulatory subunit [Anaerovoracaceae bacterium]
MVIDSIKKGIVIDHIRAGRAMTLLKYLKIDTEHETVAVIMNAISKKFEKKDIIKIENRIDIDMHIVGLLDPEATVNIIENRMITKKIKPELPKRVENVIICKNPRCVTSTEKGIPHNFVLQDAKRQIYRCEYCDEMVSVREY